MKKRATAKNVADLAKVSRTTVSFVLNNVPGMRISDETRQRVFEAVQELDYHPDATARRMVKGRTNILGFVLRQTPDQVFADRFLPEVLHGLSKAASAQGYHILIEPVPPDAPPRTDRTSRMCRSAGRAAEGSNGSPGSRSEGPFNDVWPCAPR